MLARERRVDVSTERGDRPVGPIAPERFGVLQALLAHVLSACGENRDARLDADDLAARFSIPREELQDTLSLLNLVNFGGGCYTVYAEVDEEAGIVRVDKELYGDVFRRPPRLTPLEARAIRLAIDYVGPTIAAEAHTPLDRVRKKLEETFGQFDLPQTLSGDAGDAEEKLVRTLSDAVEKRRVVEIEYLKEGDETPTTRSVEPYSFVRELPVWRVHTWDRTADGPRTYRLDRMRSARLTEESFEPREGVRPELPDRAAPRAALALPRRRPLEGRAARRPAAHRQGRARRSCRSRPTSGSSPRCSPTPARRSCSSRPTCGRASPPAPARCSRSSASRCAGSARQHEPERRSLTRGRLDLDLSPVRLRDRPHDGEPETRARSVGRRAGRPARTCARRSAAAMPSPSSATSITTDVTVAPRRHRHRAVRRRVADRVADQVVERLAQPLGIAVDDEVPALRLAQTTPTATWREQPPSRRRRRTSRAGVDSLEPKRSTVGASGEQALDARRGAAGELEQSRLAIVVRHRIGRGDRDERRDGAADLVGEDGEIVGRSSVAHPARSPIRSTAQAAVSASIGSSLSAHASASGEVVRGSRHCRAR